jgi:hypothetical protein
MRILVVYRGPSFWVELWKKSNSNVSTREGSSEDLNYNIDYDVLVTITNDTYINVDNFVPFLSQKLNFSSSYITVVHHDSMGETTIHPDFYQCNYLGYIGKNKIKDVNLETMICCSNMTEKMMLVYYNWKGIQPYYQPPEDLTINPNWTLVTGFYDLPSMDDASSALRSLEYYYSHCLSTLSLNYNMVIFCDKTTYPKIYEIRRRYNLIEKSVFYVNNFEDFPMNIYREKITENRKKIPCHDPRNTVSYYLFCMARYAMLKIAINVNTFGSSHFCWINFCISRMSLRGLELLDEGLSLNRDKFSTAYIGYISKADVQGVDFMRYGRCSMCSGFFTGNKEYMYEVCDMMEKEFVHYASLGLGHADETLMSPIYFKRPDLFDQYFSNYQTMVVNYSKCYEKPIDALRYVIPGSYRDSIYPLCSKACKMTYEGFKEQNYGLTANELIGLLKTWHSSCYYQKDIKTCCMIMKELRSVVSNKDMYEEVKTNLLSILQVTDYHRLIDPEIKSKNLIIIDTTLEENKYIWDRRLDTSLNYYIFYGNYPITRHCLVNSESISLRPMFVKYT